VAVAAQMLGNIDEEPPVEPVADEPSGRVN